MFEVPLFQFHIYFNAYILTVKFRLHEASDLFVLRHIIYYIEDLT